MKEQKKHHPAQVQVSITDRRVAYAIYLIYFVLIIGAFLTYLTPGFMGQFTIHGKQSEADGRREYGDLAMRQGDFRSAIEQYRIALALQPDYMAALVNLGTAYFKLGMLHEANDAYQDALKKNPDQPDVIYYYLAQISEKLGREEEAIQYYKASAEAAPFPFQTWRRIGAAFYSQSQWDSTIVYLNKALDSRLTLERKYIGMLKRDMNKYQDDTAIKPRMQKLLAAGISPLVLKSYDTTVFLTVMNSDPLNAEIHDMIGTSWLMKKDSAKAALYFRKAIEIDPSLDIARQHMQMIR